MNGVESVFNAHKKIKGKDPTMQEISDYIHMLNEWNARR
jgi:hypothetical protein